MNSLKNVFILMDFLAEWSPLVSDQLEYTMCKCVNRETIDSSLNWGFVFGGKATQ